MSTGLPAAADSVAMWRTALGIGVSGDYADPVSACAAQKGHYAPTSPGFGASPRKDSFKVWQCQWCTWHHGTGCPLHPLPATVSLVCLNADGSPNYSADKGSPGVCAEVVNDALGTCKVEHGARNNATEGNPVIVATGSKIERASDFKTADGLFNISRTYRSMHGKFTQEPVAYHGLGINWRLNFAWDLKLDTGFTFNKNFTVVRPDGASFDYWFNGSGIANRSNNTASGVDVTLLSPATFDANDIVNNGATFKLATEDNTEITIELFLDGTKYTRGRVTEIKQPSGYTWTFAYVSANELSTITDSFNRQFTFTWLKFAYSGEAAASARAVTSIGLPDGTSLNYTYSSPSAVTAAGQEYERLAKVERKDGGGAVIDSTTYHYEDADHGFALTGITDHKYVRYATFAYDDQGRVISTEHDGGADRTTFTYEKVGTEFHHKVTNALGKVTNYVFTKEYYYGYYMRLARVDGEASANCVADQKSFTYSGKRIATSTDEEGRITTYVRDGDGRPTRITLATGLPDEKVTDITWSATHKQPTQVVEPNITHDMAYNASGALTQYKQTDTTSHSVPYSTNGETRTWDYTYTTEGLLDTVDGPLAGTGDTIDYDYDTDGYLDKVTNELGHVTDVISVNTSGLPTMIRDANDTYTDLGYDAVGRLTTVTVAYEASTTLVYDAIGQITKITRADGSVLDMVYSDARRLTSITSGDGEKIEFTHDLEGNITKREIKNASSTLVFTHSRTFDELSRLLASIGATLQTHTYAYDKTGNLISVTDPRGNVYSYAYDDLNRLIEEINAEPGHVNLTLDAQGNTVTYEDPRNLQTTYVRNGFGEVIRRVSPDTGTTDYVRNAHGLVTQATDARGVITDYTHDALKRMTTRTYPDSADENVTLTYDATTGYNMGVGRLTGFSDESGSTALTWDPHGNVLSDVRTIGTKTYTTTYLYDAANQIAEIVYPSGRIVNYWRNAEGRMTSVETKQDALASQVTLADNIGYQPMSSIVQALDYGNGLNIWNTFTQDYEIDVLGVYDGATAIINRAHTRTDNLNLTNVWDNVVAANDQSFWYTATNRLENAGGPWGNLAFYYDGVGNRTHRIHDDAGFIATQTFGYPASSNLIGNEEVGGTTTRTFTHDAAGNMTKDVRVADTFDYAINHAGRISEVKINTVVKADYEYNAQNQLVFRSTTVVGGPSGDRHYVYDRAGRLIAEADAATGNTVREYIWLGDMPIAVVADVDTASPLLYYVHVDHLNRPVMMTDGLKASVWEAIWLPYGAIHSITGTASNDARFPGQWFQIETGLHYNWHRHYDPTLARYTQPDPLGFVDGPSVFAYALNSPQMYVDSRGEFAQVLLGAAIFGLADLGSQLLQNGGRLECVRWWEVGAAAAGGALPGAWFSGVFKHSVRNVSWLKSGSKVWKNASRRIRRAQNTPKTHDLHHWAIRQSSRLGKKFPGAANHPWNLKAVPRRFNQVDLEGMNPLARLVAGSPNWARVMGGSLGLGAAASAATSNDCECAN